MKVSDLKPGDIITEYTNFGGRSYTLEVIRVGFIHCFGDELFTSGIYKAKGYEFLCEGRKSIREIKKGHVLSPDYYQVKRNGVVIN